MEATMEAKQETKQEEKKQKCYWEIQGVDANGDIIVKVFSPERQKQINELVGTAKAKYTKAHNKLVQQDDHYAELVDVLGFEATTEIFSTAGKAYVYNVKREMAKDIKAEQNKEALLAGAQAARASKGTKETRERKEAVVITEEGAW
jgi:hypothetical protein